MNSKERVITALQLKQPDRVPFFEWDINHEVMNRIEGKRTNLIDFVEKWDIDGIIIYPNYKKSFIDDDTYIDEWKIVRKIVTEDYPIPVEGPVKQQKDLKKIEIPDPFSKHIYWDLDEAVNKFKNKRAIIFKINDVFTLLRDLRGFQNILIDLAEDENFIKEFVNLSVEYNIQLANNAKKHGADIVWSSDDFCDKRGTLMSPNSFYRLFFPGLKKLVSECKKTGLYFIKHCDGNVLQIMDLLIETGCDGYDPIDISAGMNLLYFKRKYGKKLCLLGNIDGINILQNGNPEDTASEVIRCLKEGASGGGYIIKSSTDIHSRVKPDNFVAMLKAIKKYGIYQSINNL